MTNELKVGDDVFVSSDLRFPGRTYRATVIMMGREFGSRDPYIMVEDCDDRHIVVMVDQCEKVCEGCEGHGTIVYPARQQGGDIVDEQEVTCRMCKGKGVAHLDLTDEYNNDK